MNKYDAIKKLIKESKSFVDFSDFGDGVSDEWIEKAEKRLGFNLPDSYKWWLKNYNGGEIYGEEIYSVYEEDFDTVIGGDIVYMHELNQKNNTFPKNVLTICETNDEIYYFDISVCNDGNEYPVYLYNTEKKYAIDFIDFLNKKIKNG